MSMKKLAEACGTLYFEKLAGCGVKVHTGPAAKARLKVKKPKRVKGYVRKHKINDVYVRGYKKNAKPGT